MTSPLFIEVDSLSKHYGAHQAVSDVSFHVKKGEIVGFLGPNGAGKSTTLRMITGYLAPSAGQIRIDGVSMLEKRREAQKKIGYMPEGVPSHKEMRVTEYLKFRAEIKGVPRAKLSESIERSLDQANIKDVSHRIIAQLSKGYRQRVGLADALVADPPLLILDEPTAGLDPNQIRQVRDLIRSFAGKKTVLVSTHILPEVEAVCERVVIINQGKKVGEGDPNTLRSTAAGQQTLHMIGKAPASSFKSALSDVSTVTGLEVSEHDGSCEVTLTIPVGDEHIDEVFAAIVEAKIGLRSFGTQQDSLEEVFASLTENEDLADSEGDPPDSESATDIHEEDH